ncbi:MAG: hypothetical protein M3N53_00020 [Actinomycetota bacterium]|nr:hypothetical protein [Actinomycetota bacterium]
MVIDGRPKTARVLKALLLLALVLFLYLATAWIVVMNTDACWWPWQELRFPDARTLCTSPK